MSEDELVAKVADAILDTICREDEGIYLDQDPGSPRYRYRIDGSINLEAIARAAIRAVRSR
jgi:hypothetical protein